MIKIVIADDHELIREGLKKRIGREVDMEVVAEAQNADELYKLLQEVECDVALVDISMPGKSGLDLLQDIKDSGIEVKLLVLSMHPEEQFASRAIKLGASGYITKNSEPSTIIKAIHKVLSGRIYISERFAENLAMGLTPDNQSSIHEQLSGREFQILRMLGSGKTVTQIADDLFLSQSSINTYRKRILDKMNMTTTAELVHYAIKASIVE